MTTQRWGCLLLLLRLLAASQLGVLAEQRPVDHVSYLAGQVGSLFLAHSSETSRLHCAPLRMQSKGPDYSAAESWRQHKPSAYFAEVQRAVSDTFPHLPREYDPKYTNPCWHLVRGEQARGGLCLM